MIDVGYVRVMAEYNAWQNSQLVPVFTAMDPADLTLDRGAFFGSILGTANHILWGDQAWMSRFNPAVSPPDASLSPGINMYPSAQTWSIARREMDDVISDWAAGLAPVDLEGDLTWISGVLKQEFTRPIQVCAVHIFNHQTHHRGQIHAMLTSLGQPAPVSDLVFTPKEA